MILSESVPQPYALAVFAILGATMGALYACIYFTAEFIVKKEFFRHTANIIFVCVYAALFVLCEIKFFDYNLHAYHFVIAFSASGIIMAGLWLLMRLYREKLEKKCNAAIEKIRSGKHYKRFTK